MYEVLTPCSVRLSSPSQGPPGSLHRLTSLPSGMPCKGGSGAEPHGPPQSDPVEHLQDTPPQDELVAAGVRAQTSSLTHSSLWHPSLLALAHGQESRNSRASSGWGWHISSRSWTLLPRCVEV